MATVYVTAQGDMIDAICRRAYGDESGYVERVLQANPGLSAAPPLLPAGTAIALPELTPATVTRQVVALWD